ncbi:MAG TPA: methyltransferase domain-containing protein [Vicinamibacterales bacterium]|jgi:SAM-dependent methyltransferase
MSWQQTYLDRFYGGYVDGTTEFHAMCTAHIPSGATILEVGAGPSNDTSRFLSSLGRLSGLDVDPAVRSNAYLADAFVLESDIYPFGDSCFDACVSNYVLEHIANPTSHLSEIHRILRPGGVYLFRTPNRHHYVALVSRWTPHWIHTAMANRLRRLPDEAPEPYPTYYRLNSRRAIRKAAARSGLGVRELRMVEKEPSYGMASRPMFVSFMLYERVVNSSALFAVLRANVFGLLQRPR